MKACILILTIVLFGCVQEDDVIKHTYILENTTERQLVIDFYSYGKQKGSESITGKGILFERTVDLGMGDVPTPTTAFYGSDSIIVTYDNIKQQIYTRISNANYVNISPNLRNIFFDSVYTNVNDELYRFTFTEEDYENAELID